MTIRYFKGMAKTCMIVISFWFYSVSFAQDWEFGTICGVSNYQGDIAPELKISENHPLFSLFIKRNLNQFISLGTSFSQAHISGKDANFSYLAFRNLSFETNIFEVAGIFEFNFLPFAFGLNHKNFSPFVYTGLGVFKFDPYTYYNGNKYYLVNMDTEGKLASGEKKHPYHLLQFSLPLGGGLKFSLSEKFNAGLNISYRYCFTDYLDDVSTTYPDKALLLSKKGPVAVALSDRSQEGIGTPGKQRGRSDLKDWYIFCGIFISYKIRNSVCAF